MKHALSVHGTPPPRGGGRGDFMIYGAHSCPRIGRVERREAIGVVRSGLFHGQGETAEMARNDYYSKTCAY